MICRLSAAADRAGLTPHQVRNYVQFRLLGSPQRDARGHLRFDDAAINRLRLIGLATKAGVTLDALRPFLMALDSADTAALKQQQALMRQCVAERRGILRTLMWHLKRAYESPTTYSGRPGLETAIKTRGSSQT